VSFLPFYSLSTIPMSGRWSVSMDLAVLLVAALAFLLFLCKPQVRRDLLFVAGGTALAVALAVPL